MQMIATVHGEPAVDRPLLTVFVNSLGDFLLFDLIRTGSWAVMCHDSCVDIGAI